MLYERWLNVVGATPDRLAIWDGATGRSHTFEEIAHEVRQWPLGKGGIQFAEGTGLSFILSVLAGWREGRVICPLEPGQPRPEVAGEPPDRVLHLKLTSATSGVSRMIAFTADQLVADCDHVVSSMQLSPSLPNVAAISLAHSYGFSNLVLPLLLKGIPMFLAASPLPESVRTAISRAPGVTLPAVPALWQAWHEAGILSQRVRIAISAGAPLPLTLEQTVFEATGVKIHNFYGSSECGGIAFDRTPVPRTDAALAGTPLDSVQVGVNPDGCVTVRSDAVGIGYWPDPESSLAEGQFQSGDLGRLAGEGVYLLGRSTDRINVAGRKVIPEDVERVLTAHPAVKDCLVFGVPSDNIRNETIVACVSLHSKVLPSELTEFLQSRLPSWQMPRDWWMLDSLGVNQRGKRSRGEWRARYLNRYRTG
jgi:acyl-CoA synthetase (AMP-forming)/AMP-acid ligase II